jgi:alpha-tubulin suppressor-like RCC1 family protein
MLYKRAPKEEDQSFRMSSEDQPRGIAGGEHTLVHRAGRVLSGGACGLGWNRTRAVGADEHHWKEAPLPESISSVFAGYYHNLAVGASGKLYSWGCGTFTEGGGDGIIPALGQVVTLSDCCCIVITTLLHGYCTLVKLLLQCR